jgi:hypothetical protein
LALALLAAGAVRADPGAAFDLAGPDLVVRVTRGDRSLPISEIPNLAAGDRLAIKADLPPTQSAHYLLVAVFLRGATNPPPESWFYRCETWSSPCRERGLSVTVPAEAQQVLLFLAPATGGDFRTLVGAVRGRPGAFVRASQALNQAALDRSRLDTYLAAIRALDATDRARLTQAAPLLARSLAIKVDEKCLDRIPELQAPCLMQGQDSLILNDGHSVSIVEALTSGPAADLAMEASYTPQMSYGYYSPYIASVLDIARIMGSINSAHFQYIPALISAHGERAALSLNTPPSFHDPKSVLVAALPAVEQPQSPPLHAVNAKDLYCARKTALVLPVEGAPLAFSTAFAHDVRLRIAGASGKVLELPARADAEQGGFVVDTSALGAADLGDALHGSLHGYWGFEPYEGPAFALVDGGSQSWRVGTEDSGAMIVGREATLHLHAANASCLESLALQDASGLQVKPVWKTVKPDDVEVKLPLERTQPGMLTLLVSQYGAAKPEALSIEAFADPGHLDAFTMHAGDDRGVLKGTRLDQVAKLVIKGAEFAPVSLTSGKSGDELTVAALDAKTVPALKPGDAPKVRVTLKDGRSSDLLGAVLAQRPSVVLITQSVEAPASSSENPIALADGHDLPQGARLAFSVRARAPANFAHDEKIEVATEDEEFSTLLSVGAGITLEDRKVAVVRFDPGKAFGPAAFGALRFRVVEGDANGDWQPLATLVRLPELTTLQCPATPELACKLSGSNLFLVDSIAADPGFAHPLQIPDGFPGDAVPVPHPSDGELYLKLRDDPTAINVVSVHAEALAASTAPPPAPAPEAAVTAAVASASTAASATNAAAPATASVPAAAASPAPMPAAPPSLAPAPVATSAASLGPASGADSNPDAGDARPPAFVAHSN